jgi:hypothetical protein
VQDVKTLWHLALKEENAILVNGYAFRLSLEERDEIGIVRKHG